MLTADGSCWTSNKVGVGIYYSCEPVYPYPMISYELPAASTPGEPLSFAICIYFIELFWIF